MSYKVVLFDWGGVLSVGGTPDELAGRVSTLFNITDEETRKLLAPRLTKLKRGRSTVDDFWSSLESEMSCTISDSQRNVWAPVDTLRPQQDMVEFTKKLQGLGYKTAILSNVFPNTAEDIRSQGWYEPYEPVFLSSDDGMAKPDMEYYEYAVAQLGVKPEEIIFIDDQQRCLEPAARFGMATVLAVGVPQVISDVSRLLGISK